MVPSIPIPISSYISPVSLPDQISHQQASHQQPSPHDVQRFEQALAFPQATQAPSAIENVSTTAIGKSIAALENKEAENKAEISRIFDPDLEITPLTVLELNMALEERSIGYTFAGKMVSAPSQWIKELTSMQ